MARGTSSVGIGAVVAAALLSLGALAGCGGDGDGNEATVELDEQVGFDGDSVFERQARAENLIRACMRKQGFDYVPLDPAAQQAELVGTRGLSEEEFNEQFGYGITTLYEERLRQSVTGPNQDYYATLTAEEQAAYDRALYGEDKTATFAVALDTGNFSKLGGCLKEATTEVFGGPELVADLTAALDELDEQILADQRVFDAVEEWSACMRRAGYDLAEQDEVDVYLENALEGIVGPLEEAEPTPAGAEPAYDVEALRALQREEVEMVKADIACEEEHVEEIEVKVRTEYEREFRERNAALLEQVPAA
jgi:hypothetical protein